MGGTKTAQGTKQAQDDTQLQALQNDEDIQGEAEALQHAKDTDTETKEERKDAGAEAEERVPVQMPASTTLVDLNWSPNQGGHKPSQQTVRMFNEVGGANIRRGTEAFYQLAFQDPVIDRFLRSHEDPHGLRFAAWIQEKFGVGQPWTDERVERVVCPFMAHGNRFNTPHDRSSAHYAAWHSPKREREKWGDHFKLDDCRVWMRLHFAAMRETGCFDHPVFEDYYVKFIGHFVSVYERFAPAFARDSARWSLDPKNMERYLASGRHMPDVTGRDLDAALQDLPEDERSGRWPYSR